MNSALKLYIIGLTVNIIYLLIVINTDNIISQSWRKDDGHLEKLLIKYNNDTKSYIDSADNFIKYGVFGNKLKPDYHRTIGYPAIIAFFKILFKEYWYFALVFFQVIFGALIYPISFLIGKLFLKKEDKLLFISILALIVLGGYFTKSVYVLSDLTFSVFFISGIYFSILSVLNINKIYYIILAVVILSFSALIRPVLILYPFAHVLLLIYFSKCYNTWKIKKIKYLIFGSGFVLLLTCNLSSLRVYHYYNYFTPTDILAYDLDEYISKSTLSKEGKSNEYLEFKNKITHINNWIEKDKLRKKFFFSTAKKYPISTVSYLLGRGALVHLFYPHYMQIGEIFGYYNKKVNKYGDKMIKSIFMELLLYFGAFINFILFALFCLYLFKILLLKKDFLLFFAIITLVFLVLGPTFIAASSPRMRLPIEPFIVIFAFRYFKILRLRLNK